MGKDKKKSIKKIPWKLTLIMSIIFGVLGVDRFIMRHVWLGILKLFTLAGLGVWWIIDIILISHKYPFDGLEWK